MARLDVDDGPGGHRLLLAAGGAVASALVVVLAVAVLPARSSAPVAVSATTMPPFTLAPADAAEPEVRSVDPDTADDTASSPAAFTASSGAGPVKVASAVAPTDGVELTGAPHAVAAPLRTVEVDDEVGRPVHVVTASHVYQVELDDLERVIAPDGTVVIDDAGRLLGSFVDGRFVAD